jgi:hypothetical protein
VMTMINVSTQYEDKNWRNKLQIKEKKERRKIKQNNINAMHAPQR